MHTRPTRRSVLIAAASTAVSAVLPIPTPTSPSRWTADLWEALDAQLEGFDLTMRRMKPSVVDLLEPIVEGELEQGELLAERLMAEGRIPERLRSRKKYLVRTH